MACQCNFFRSKVMPTSVCDQLWIHQPLKPTPLVRSNVHFSQELFPQGSRSTHIFMYFRGIGEGLFPVIFCKGLFRFGVGGIPTWVTAAALLVPSVGARYLLCLYMVLVRLYLRIVLLSRHNPAAMRSCCGGKRGFCHTPRNHSNRLLAADEGCASAPVRHMVYDGNFH